jgi:uncharacterized protein
MKCKQLVIPVGVDEKVSGIVCTPGSEPDNGTVGVIIAHGAGNDMHEPMIVKVCEGLADSGHVTLRFNFAYREKGQKAPDTQAKLENTWECVHRFFTESLPYTYNAIIVGGKSMGGRVASQMAAAGKLQADGLILLGYPLHAPGKKDTLRDSHLYGMNIPMLFFAGTRDTLCDLSLLNGVLNKLKASWDLMVIEGGDHSFHLPKSVNISQEDVYSNVVKKCNGWVQTIFLKKQ